MRDLFEAALSQTRDLLLNQIEQARNNGVQLKVSFSLPVRSVGC
jgi:hypothetical protein